MAMEITNNYSSYAVQNLAGSSAANSTKKKETEKTSETIGSSKSKSTSEYANELAKLVPSVEFRVGSSYASAKKGQTLTVNPQLLEKMQNDPEKEKEMKELIKGVESMTKLFDGMNQASGWTTVFKHSYIDENGKYCHIALIRNDYMLNMSEKLREERRKNSEKLIEKTREKAAEKKEELEELLEEQKEVNAEEEEKTGEESETEETDGSVYNKVEQLLNEKIADSKDGMIYLDDADFKTIMEMMKEDKEGKGSTKEQTQVGANLDLQV